MSVHARPHGNDRILVLCRHGQSEGNQRNVFTGLLDLPLTEEGEEEARQAARRIHDLGLSFGAAFTSDLLRSKASARLMLDEVNHPAFILVSSAALNERDYGALAGMNKDEARKRFGADQIHQWRRSYDQAPPFGESLRDTVARVLPFYVRHILPAALRGGALVVAHGNSLRALVMALDGLTPDAVPNLEIGTGDLIIYHLDADSTVTSKDTIAG